MELTAAKGVTEIVAPSRAERTIARRSAEARATIPDLELSAEVDMTTAVARGLPIDAALVRACAAALRENPLANGSYRDGNYELHSRINIGITIETEDGLVVPTVLDADQKSLAELEAELELLAARAGEGEFDPPTCRARPSPSPTPATTAWRERPRSSSRRRRRRWRPAPSARSRSSAVRRSFPAT